MEICGMQKDMIVAAGYNIYPKENDEILFDHPIYATPPKVDFKKSSEFYRNGK